MLNKKAQGLPLSFIVIAAISALVLILIVVFTIGGFGSFGKQIMGTAPSDLEAVRDSCRTSCSKLATMRSASEWVQSAYCEKTYAVDLDGDGKAGGNKEDSVYGTRASKESVSNNKLEVGLRCWDEGISVSCTQSVTTATGSSIFCNNPQLKIAGADDDVCAETDCT